MRTALALSVLCVVSACGPELSQGGDALETGQLESEICADGPTTVEGIDVSRFQGPINWAGVKSAGKKFAIIQAGRGTSPDPQFAANWAGAKANGIIRGTYLRFFPDQSLDAQANILINANATLQVGDLPPMLDVEDRGGTTPDRLATLVGQLIAKVKAGTGRDPIIYTGYFFWKDFVKSTAFGKYPLVIANYSSSCPPIPAGWSKWTIHQYTSSGHVTGITGNVDLDRFNGTLAQLQALTQATPTPAPTGVVTGAIYRNNDITQRVSDATVTVAGKTQTTGTDGLYRFELPAGTYVVSATKAGFEKSTVSRTVTSGATIWGSMNLVRSTVPPGILTGVVYEDGNTSHRVAGASVTVDGVSQLTGADGLFRFELPPGDYSAVVRKLGYTTASTARTVTSGATVWASTNIQASSSQGLTTGTPESAPEVTALVGGLYRLDTLESLAGKTVELIDASGAVVASAFTDEQGAYRLSLPGEFSGQLRVRADGFREERIALSVQLGELRVMDVGLAPASAASEETAELSAGDVGCTAGAGATMLWLAPLLALVLARRRSAARVS